MDNIIKKYFIVGSDKYIEELRRKGVVLEEVKNKYVVVNLEGETEEGSYIKKIYRIKKMKKNKMG